MLCMNKVCVIIIYGDNVQMDLPGFIFYGHKLGKSGLAWFLRRISVCTVLYYLFGIRDKFYVHSDIVVECFSYKWL